jgi:hypothetical protein
MHWRHYDNLAELEADTPAAINRSYLKEVLERGGSYWLGVEGGFAAVQEYVRSGWKEGYERMVRMGEKLLPKELEVATAIASRRKRKRTMGEQGASVDMDRVWQGNLDRAWNQMRHVIKISTSPRNVGIFVDLGASAGVTAESLTWRGAVAVKLIDWLMKSGYSVSLYVGCCSIGNYYSKNSMASVHSVKIKDYQQQLSPEHVAAACSTGFYRTYLFKSILCEKEALQAKVVTGLGRPMSHPDMMPQELIKDKAAGARIVRIDGNVTCESSARSLALSILKQLKAESVPNVEHR